MRPPQAMTSPSSDGEIGEFGERWLTKRELAAYLQVTPRFIELQQQHGLPVLRMGAVNRYRISEVEAWCREQYPPTQKIDEQEQQR